MRTKKMLSGEADLELHLPEPDSPTEDSRSDNSKSVIHPYPNLPEVEAGILLKWADAESLKAEFVVDLSSQAAYLLGRFQIEVFADGKNRSLIGQTETVVALLKCVDPTHKVKVKYLSKADLNGIPNLELHALLKSKTDPEKIEKAIELCQILKIKTPKQSQLAALLNKDASSISKLLKRMSLS